MSSIPPSLPPSLPLPASPPQASVATVVGDPKGQLARLAPGDLVRATASAVSGETVEVKTADGPLLVKLPQAIPPGTSLQFQVVSLGETPQLRLLPLDAPNQAGGTANAASSPPSPAPTAPTETVAAGSAAAPAPQSGIVATVVRAGGGPDGFSLPAGTSFTVRIAQIASPSDAAAPVPDDFAGAASSPEAPFTAAQLARTAYGASTAATAAPFPWPQPEAAGGAPLAKPVGGTAVPNPSPAEVIPREPPPAAEPPPAPEPAPSLAAVAAEDGMAAAPPPSPAPPPPAVPPPIPIPSAATPPTPPLPVPPSRDAGAPPPSPAEPSPPPSVSADADAPATPPAAAAAPPIPPPPNDLPAPPLPATAADAASASAPPAPNPAPAAETAATTSQAASPGTPSSAAPPPPAPAQASSSAAPSDPPPSTAEDGDPAPDTPDTAPSLPQTLSGVVAPNSHGGYPLIQTKLGLLSLAGGSDLVPGLRMDLEIVGDPSFPDPDSAAQQQPGDDWPAISETLALLQQADPRIATALATAMPDLATRLAAHLIALVAGIRAKDLGAWWGEESVKQIEKTGGRDLIRRLEKELAEFKAPVRLPTGGEWQSITLPLMLDQRIERIRLVVRRPPDDNRRTEAREEEGTRFLLDVEMTRLGPVQLDGLVKRAAKRFDLIVRSRTALPDPMKRDIGAIFARSLDGMGMAGSATFQQAARFIDVLPQGPSFPSGWVI